MFYRITIYLIFLLTGYSSFSAVGLLKVLIPITELNKGFTNTFIVFYLFLPFLSILVRNLTEKQHVYLLMLCAFTYILMGSFAPILDVEFNYITWYTVLFFIASYIRLYPKNIFNKTKIWGFLTLFLVMIGIITVFICTWFGVRIGKFSPYCFLGESNRLLAVVVAISAFLFFKNLKIKANSFINTVAASTFAVLLIHSNSSTMRTWLWKDIMRCLEAYNYGWVYLHAIGCVCVIFVACIIIDYIRIHLIENPLMNIFDKKINSIVTKYKKIETKIFEKFSID